MSWVCDAIRDVQPRLVHGFYQRRHMHLQDGEEQEEARQRSMLLRDYAESAMLDWVHVWGGVVDDEPR